MTWRYLGARLVGTLGTLAGVTVLVFFVLRALPGDAVTAKLGTETGVLTGDQLAALERYYGLDQPLWQQFTSWLGSVLTGNLGVSVDSGASVGSLIWSALPVTLELAVLSILISTPIGIALGMVAASRPGRTRDVGVQTFGLLGLAVPEFVIASVAVAALASAFSYFPDPGSYVSLTESVVGNLSQMLYPALVLSVGLVATIMRTTRSAYLEAQDTDFVRTARGKGLSPRRDPAAARAAQRLDPDRDDHRHPVWLPAGRHRDHRADLRATRPGAVAAHRHPAAGLRRRAEHGAVHRGGVRPGEPARRPDLPGPRPTGEAAMSASGSPTPGTPFVAEVEEGAAPGGLRDTARGVWRDPNGRVGLLVTTALALLAGLAVAGLTPNDPVAQHPGDQLVGPSGDYWFGTDQFGRDIASRTFAGIASSLRVAFVAVGGAALVGTVAGVASGYLGGFWDQLTGRLTDVLFAFPATLLALAIIAALGRGWFNTAIAIAIVYIPIFVRVARAPTLAVRELEYISACKVLGFSGRRTLFRHVLPNVSAPVVVQVALALSWAILTEAGLSFLGLGTQPPDASLGLMVSEARNLITTAWWTMVPPALAVVITVVGLNLLGDGLRSALDPKEDRR